MRVWMGAALLAWLGGCAALSGEDGAVGWTAQLYHPLVIPADAATVRLQYGEVVAANSVQEYDPFCIIELETVRPHAQTLRPGRFEVLRVTRSVNPVAAAGASQAVALSFDGSPTFLYYVTEFRLRDPEQPELRGMRCAWNQLAPGNRSLMRHLALDEIHGALGRWMRLTPGRAVP